VSVDRKLDLVSFGQLRAEYSRLPLKGTAHSMLLGTAGGLVLALLGGLPLFAIALWPKLTH